MEEEKRKVGVENITSGRPGALAPTLWLRCVLTEWMYRLFAIVYLLHKALHVFPIVGGRKVEHLKQNTQVLGVSLSPEQIHRINDAKPTRPWFPSHRGCTHSHIVRFREPS